MRPNPNSASTEIAKELIARYAEAGKLPSNCDFAQIGDLHSVSLYSEFEPSALIRETVFGGMDTDKETALLKALVECAERSAIAEGRRSNNHVCAAPRSDGFAAFPLVGHDRHSSLERARRHALAEAVERFTWATWWDRSEYGCAIDMNAGSNFDKHSKSVIQGIYDLLPVKRTIEIKPFLDSEFCVVIYFLELENGGLVSGGASDLKTAETSAILRALGELARHAVCASKVLAGATGETFYERRLEYMARENTVERLRRRLENSGSKSIALPELLIDDSLPHSLDHLVYVHRCLFEDQPPFIGGDLERLCL